MGSVFYPLSQQITDTAAVHGVDWAAFWYCSDKRGPHMKCATLVWLSCNLADCLESVDRTLYVWVLCAAVWALGWVIAALGGAESLAIAMILTAAAVLALGLAARWCAWRIVDWAAHRLTARTPNTNQSEKPRD
jgi:amino acid transporter